MRDLGCGQTLFPWLPQGVCRRTRLYRDEAPAPPRPVARVAAVGARSPCKPNVTIETVCNSTLRAVPPAISPLVNCVHIAVIASRILNTSLAAARVRSGAVQQRRRRAQDASRACMTRIGVPDRVPPRAQPPQIPRRVHDRGACGRAADADGSRQGARTRQGVAEWQIAAAERRARTCTVQPAPPRKMTARRGLSL